MALYLVTAIPKTERLKGLQDLLRYNAFVDLRPFGKVLSYSLANARIRPDGVATWEERRLLHPPLAEERLAVLDKYFSNIQVEPVARGKGWDEIALLPKLFP